MPAIVTLRRGLRLGIPARTVRTWADRMLCRLALEPAELSVLLTGDDEIRGLNRTFRRRDEPTDVLAFSMREGAGAGARAPGDRVSAAAAEILGDVVVSLETARRQAGRRRRRLETEVRELLAHGLLHLVGYDHQTKAEERVMRAETQKLCRAALRRLRRSRQTR